MNPIISIVMPTYNRADAIGLTLEHLTKQTLSPSQFEVIVVDDGSTDDTENIVMSQKGPICLTYLKQPNRGAATTRNIGVRQARADLILFLDSDVVPEPQLVETHLQCFAQVNSHLVVGRVKPWPGTPRPWHEQLIAPESVGMDYGDTTRNIPFYMALGGNFSITRTVFTKIGGYDEKFPSAGCEETEFAYRAELMGHSLFYEPRAVGYHNHPRTLEQRCRQQAAHMRSMALLIAKHSEMRTVIPGVDELMPILSHPRSKQRLWRRCQASLFGSPPVRTALYRSLMWLDKRRIGPRLASILFWRLLTGWRYVGFREGLQTYGCVISGDTR